MLKLPKGLKKKKKGKKSKKDQELFTEEELAQYKREHQHHQEEESHSEEQQQQQQQQQGTQEGENDDEWRKFAALTTGIDSVLKKTQGDLDRIKSTSFFQRAAPQKKKEEVKVEEKVELEEVARAPTPEELDPAKKLLNAVVELSESESDSEVDDTAFDTTFLEKVETGEIPVYYIPEEEETDLGPDPFDTEYAEKVITGPEVSKRGKKIVNIGAAVEVLTGKAEAQTSSAARKRRQRRGIQNLLLESFEVEQEEDREEPLEPKLASPPKTILDEPAELADEVPIDLSVSLHLAYQPIKEKKEESENFLDEFDVIKTDDIFVTDTLPKQETDSTDWSEFELDRCKSIKFKFSI